MTWLPRRWPSTLGIFAPLLLLGLSLPRPAAGQAAVASQGAAEGRRYSPLELERIRRALVRVGGVIDTQPEGKRIESIEVVALPVFEPEDPGPKFLNWFHATTRDDVIEREVLFRVGGSFEQRRSDEIERNLRSLLLFSVVLALPVRGTSEDRVRYVVVTKDLWSLRVGWDGRINKGVIDYLSMQPTERNLLGTGRQLFGTLAFGRRTYTVGGGFYEPRLAGSRTRILVRADAVVNCEKGEVEGSSGAFQYSRPLYSTRTRWSYGTSIAWANSRNPLPLAGNLEGAICSAPSSDEIEVTLRSGKVAILPNRYFYDSQSFAQSFTRSYGTAYKTNLSFGMEALRAASREDDLSNVRAAASEQPLSAAEYATLVNFYRGLISVSDTRIGPYFQLQSFTTNFHRDINSETLALQEDVDFRLGHIATLKLYPALRALGSTRDLLGVEASLSYARSVDTGYLKVAATHEVELSTPEQTDASLSLAFRFTSPRLALGRFVYDARLTDHYLNYRNTRLGLGGTNRLRGYANTAAVGSHLLVGNLEFRSRPVEILSAQLAAVLFHDVGDAFSDFGQLELRQGVGGGIRFLAPQLDRDVFRIDVGVPVPFNAPQGEITVIATFGQAFELP
jgi:outer membrane protein assembly factor BamA